MKSDSFRFWICVTAVLIAGFSSSSSRADEPTDVQTDTKTALYWFGEGYATLLLNSSKHAVKAPSGNGADRFYVKDGDVQASWYNKNSSEQKASLISLYISKKGHLINDIYIGATERSTHIYMFGKPDNVKENWVAYRGISEICPDSITFKFSGDILEEVDWDWCTD